MDYSTHPKPESLPREMCCAALKLRIGRPGRAAAARSITRWLENRQWSGSRLEVHAEEPIDWICPNVLSPDVRVDGFRFRSNEFRQNADLQLMQGGRVLYQKRIGHLRANDSLNLSGEWVEKVDFDRRACKTCHTSVSHGKVNQFTVTVQSQCWS